MEGKKLLDLLIEELSSECYFEPVKENVLEEVGLKKEDVFLPRIATEGSAGADFFAPYSFELAPGEEIRIPTGVKAHCHRYTRLSIVPKSGLGFKYYTRLANTIGIIDEDYYGNTQNDGCIFIKIRNEGSKPFAIERGQGFYQGIFELYIPDRDSLSNTHAKRDGGFGSTNARV